jgi:hypothetical protein
MPIIAFFRLGGEEQSICIDGSNVFFIDVATGETTTIEGLQLNKLGVFKEFPELKGNPDWRKIAIKRFKEKVKEYKTEMDRINYCKEELTKHGYTALFYQRAGFRPQKFR